MRALATSVFWPCFTANMRDIIAFFEPRRNLSQGVRINGTHLDLVSATRSSISPMVTFAIDLLSIPNPTTHANIALVRNSMNWPRLAGLAITLTLDIAVVMCPRVREDSWRRGRKFITSM